MRPRLLRPFLIFEFLIALQVLFTFWSQVGGQYHLDLMFWPWKFGLSVGAALLIAAITADLFRAGGAVTRKALLYGSLLIVTIVVAGVVTYYYHLNEPADEDEDTQDTPAKITRIPYERNAHAVQILRGSLPGNAAGFSCTRSLNLPRRPAPSATADSP